MGPGVTGNDTVASVLAQRAAAYGHRPFATFEAADGSTTQRSWGETLERAARMAGLLSAAGVGRGDRVHVHLGNRPAFYDAWFGCAVLGAVMVPTNPLLAPQELAYSLEHSGARVSVTETGLVPVVVDAKPDGVEVIVVGTEGSEDVLGGRTPRLDGPGPAPDDVAAILYTSGTTSRPKGVMVTHANYLYAGEVVAQHLRVRPDDTWLIVLPLFHANAQYYSTMSALVSGASVAVAERFSASRWSQQAVRHGATLASLFAAPIRMILARPPHPDDARHRLRAAIFSQNVTTEQLAAFEDRFRCPLVQLYGMTETIAPPTLNPLFGERRNMTIGRPTLPSRVRIVDRRGRDVVTGEVGELLVAGEPGRTLMAGYLDDPDATAGAIRDGWLHTGDNVVASPDGYIRFVDRAKDMIKRAGENVAASEVEAAVNSHPGVFESAAVGVPDEVRDEAIKVYVVPAPGADLDPDAIIVWCRERLASFKVPSIVEFLDRLPRTSVGKIRKDVLRGMDRDRSLDRGAT